MDRLILADDFANLLTKRFGDGVADNEAETETSGTDSKPDEQVPLFLAQCNAAVKKAINSRTG